MYRVLDHMDNCKSSIMFEIYYDVEVETRQMKLTIRNSHSNME